MLYGGHFYYIDLKSQSWYRIMYSLILIIFVSEILMVSHRYKSSTDSQFWFAITDQTKQLFVKFSLNGVSIFREVHLLKNFPPWDPTCIYPNVLNDILSFCPICISNGVKRLNFEEANTRPEALKSLYRSPGNKKNQLVLCKNYVLQW